MAGLTKAKAPGSSCKGLRDVSDEVSEMFEPDRHADQCWRDSDFAARFLCKPRIHRHR
jgi:hypothetical protein